MEGGLAFHKSSWAGTIVSMFFLFMKHGNFIHKVGNDNILFSCHSNAWSLFNFGTFLLCLLCGMLPHSDAYVATLSMVGIYLSSQSQ
jgi:hypothetical protein